MERPSGLGDQDTQQMGIIPVSIPQFLTELKFLNFRMTMPFLIYLVPKISEPFDLHSWLQALTYDSVVGLYLG